MRSKYIKMILCVIYDVIVCEVSLIMTFAFGNLNYFHNSFFSFINAFVFWPAIMVLFSYVFHIYNVIWRYARILDYIKLMVVACVSACCLYVVQSAVSAPFQFSAYIAIAMICSFLGSFGRMFIRKLLIIRNSTAEREEELSGNIMVIGGGSAGHAIINDINLNCNKRTCRVKCVIDDDPAKKGLYICGARIIGGREEIISATKKYEISIIVFAIPSCTGEQKSNFLRLCQKTSCKLRTVPSMYKLLMDSSVNISTIRKVEIEDLLGRDPVRMEMDNIMNYVKNKVVMVTGGGGSIGSELCRQIAAYSPRKLIVFDIYENNAYEIQNELKHDYPNLDIEVLIGSVRDLKRLECIFEKYKPQIVYHAAAHKHVPLMEDSPNETIKNNVFGTYNTVKCADSFGVEKFVLISSDKAVNPTNIMGASKRICEMIVQSFNKHSKTEFVAVRFGNVLGSNGSVIPLFKKQIAQGGPVTVTDPEIIRYFMTIPEAVSLVLQAGASARGGEIFVLDMGEPVKIIDLAENLIRLSGLIPYADIRIEFTGLRPGEKLYEEMLMSEEGLMATENSLIHIGKPIEMDEELLAQTLEEMQQVMYNDCVDIRALVKRIVSTYQYTPVQFLDTTTVIRDS